MPTPIGRVPRLACPAVQSYHTGSKLPVAHQSNSLFMQTKTAVNEKVSLMMIYTHVLNRRGQDIQSGGSVAKLTSAKMQDNVEDSWRFILHAAEENAESISCSR